MKKILLFLVSIVASVASAQTLNVVQNGVVYQIPAAQAGDMSFVGGTSVEIMGKSFALSDVTRMYVDDTPVADNTVSIVYDDDEATVFVAGNVAPFVDATISGAHVTLTQNDDLDDETGKIEYILSGSSADGSFTMTGSYKMDLTLEGLTLTNPSGAAIDIQNGKKINVSVKKGTVNTLTDGSNGDQKACFVLKGHAEFKGQGTLNVYGNTAHGIKTSDFMTMKNCTVNILKAVNDGIHANEYFWMESGSLTINNVGGDGIQAELDGTSSTGETTDHEDEDTGNIYVDGGTLTITVTAAGTKCIKSDTTVRVSGGELTLTAKGAIDTTDSSNYSYTAGIKGNDVVVDGGSLDITVTGTAGRGVSADNSIMTNGGTLNITNSGAGQTATNDTYTAKGLKADNSINLNAGTITINMSGTGGKGIKSAGTYTQGLTDGTGPTLTINTSGAKLGSSSGGGGGGGRPGGGGGWGGGSSSTSSSSKAIKVQGTIVVYGGETVVTTKTDGAEGLESKTSIDIQGGKHYFQCYDDCINSKGKIFFNGGATVCHSTGNDAIDSNAGTTGAITIGNGIAFAYSSRGGAEEGFDCDNNSYIQITGTGIGISAGGSQGGGGGGWGGGSSSGNTISNAKQGYAFVTNSISYKSNTYYTLADASGNNLVTYSFLSNVSSSLALFTATGMVKNGSYTVKSSTTAPTDATTEWHGLYLGSSASGSTSVTSFTAK
ncbi:MAG: carbohydrate-binding domain-containing protein [Prevotella sp.]|nr:carbohydrate-binding domain-containing protein [Prevotella sp.]